MIVVGLTGSIGMGKSNAAGALRALGVPVHDADGEVHRLLGPGGGAVKAVAAAFPGVLAGNRIDRKALGDRVFGDTAALRRLEAILHPLVRRSSRRFQAAAARRGVKLAVLDIPLLYESRGEKTVDAVIVVSAPALVQTTARSGAAGHDRGEIPRDPDAAGAGPSKAQAGRLRGRDRRSARGYLPAAPTDRAPDQDGGPAGVAETSPIRRPRTGVGLTLKEQGR